MDAKDLEKKVQEKEEQIEEGKRFFSHKYPDMKYLAYFQAYTNTYADVQQCIALYEEALQVDDVIGIVIATRPDAVSTALLDYLEELNRRTFLILEYGVESANDETLRRINRGHTFATSVDAIRKTAERGIRVGAHIILGLPGEGHDELMRQARIIATLPITTFKIHQLQIIRGTRIHKEWQEHPWFLPSVKEYIEWVLDYVSLLPSSMVLERFVSTSPSSLLVAPRWGLKGHEFTDLLHKAIECRTLSSTGTVSSNSNAFL